MWLILSAMALMTSVLIHAIAMRFVASAGAVAVFVAIGGTIGIALTGYCVASYGLTPATPAAALTYSFLCELYIFLFTLVGNSVSFGLLTKLARHPLKRADIANFYRTEAMVGRRFEQLERGNLITAGSGGFRLTTRGERVVRIFSFVHALFRRPNQWASGKTRGGGDDAS
jgi:hypothetical protein